MTNTFQLLLMLLMSYHSRPLLALPVRHATTRRTLSTTLSAVTADSVASYLNQPPTDAEVFALSSFLHQKRRLVVVTGAGVSTSSGIPDYRGPQGSYKLGHKPMMHQDFVKSEAARKRYWARSMLGWSTFAQARINDAHLALANLESHGIISTVITQNVDRLHQKAGSLAVIDLHGRNDRVSCLTCQCNLSRRLLQTQIDQLNPSFRTRIDLEVARLQAVDAATSRSTATTTATATDTATSGVESRRGDEESATASSLRAARGLLNEVERRVIPDWPVGAEGKVVRATKGAVAQATAPPISSTNPMASVLRADGDAELGMTDFSAFMVPSCPRCSTGILKPDVVFFGDSVHPSRVQDAYSAVEQCDGMLVVGTSLEVYSAFRFVDRASKSGKPIAIVNMGSTRAEREQLPGIVFKSESNCAALLKQVADQII